MEYLFQCSVEKDNVVCRHMRKSALSGNLILHCPGEHSDTKGGVTAVSCMVTVNRVGLEPRENMWNRFLPVRTNSLGVSLCSDVDCFSREFGFYSSIERAAIEVVKSITKDYDDDHYRSASYGKAGAGDTIGVDIWYDKQ